MNRTKLNVLFLFAALFVASVAGLVRATDTRARAGDSGELKVSTGSAYVDVSAADYTSATALLTIAPQNNHALQDVKVVIDLNKSSTGFQGAHYTSQTIQFRVARKVDGTNWRRAKNLLYPTSALSADNSAAESVEIDLGTVDPDGSARVEVLLSAENGTDIELPYRVTYRSLGVATITPQTN